MEGGGGQGEQSKENTQRGAGRAKSNWSVLEKFMFEREHVSFGFSAKVCLFVCLFVCGYKTRNYRQSEEQD